MTNSRATSATVEKAFTILDLIHRKGRDGLALSEVCAQVQMSKSTVHRYLATFEKLTVIERDEKNRYHPGLKLVELAGETLANIDFVSRSKPYMLELVGRFEETVNLAVPSGAEIVYVAKLESSQSLRMASQLGSRMPMSTTSLGKAILARYPCEQVMRLFSDGLPCLTPNSITSMQDLLKELQHVRARGFAIDDQENVPQVRCVGAPILNYDVDAIGAISVASPANRMSMEKCVEIGLVLKEMTLEISRGIGYKP